MGALGFIDGQIVDLSEKVISMEDRGYQFGDGVYEYAKVYNGKCFSLKPHIDRLYRSLRELRIPAVFTYDEMVSIHERLIAESGIQNGGIYLQSISAYIGKDGGCPKVKRRICISCEGQRRDNNLISRTHT